MAGPDRTLAGQQGCLQSLSMPACHALPAQRFSRAGSPGGQRMPRALACPLPRPPELITDGILTPAADVYAFGVLAW